MLLEYLLLETGETVGMSITEVLRERCNSHLSILFYQWIQKFFFMMHFSQALVFKNCISKNNNPSGQLKPFSKYYTIQIGFSAPTRYLNEEPCSSKVSYVLSSVETCYVLKTLESLICVTKVAYTCSNELEQFS